MAHHHEHEHHCSCHHHEHHHNHHHEHGCGCGCHHHDHHHEHGGIRGQIAIITATVVLLIGAVLIEKYCALETWQLLCVYLIPYLLVGHDTLKEAAEGILSGDMFNEHFLMTVATIGALCIGFLPGSETEFPEAVFVMLFFQVGEMFEGYAEGKSRESISHLMDIRPDTAHVVRGGKTLTVSPDEVQIGETIIVNRGEKIPLDGKVTEGHTTLDTAALTGESAPREVSAGDDVVSGCINLGWEIRLATSKSFGESTVSKILELVENADANKSQSEAFITRFARIYTPIVVFAAVALAFIPPFFADSYAASFSTWLYRALVFLVVSCPCALVISVPLTFFGGLGGASRQGILIKGSTYMDSLAKVNTVVFDKTGTLTHGTVAETLEADGHTKRIVANDCVKDDSAEAIAMLKRLGVKKTVMLTGDRKAVGEAVAKLVGIDEYYAELLPTDKVDRLTAEINNKPAGTTVAFVGDGINDAPVLKRADVGIAMGALGSDAAIEAADVVLMDDKPSKIATAINIARRTINIAKQNVWFAIGVKVAILILAALGIGNMWLAVFGDVGVTVLAVFNAIRALQINQK